MNMKVGNVEPSTSLSFSSTTQTTTVSVRSPGVSLTSTQTSVVFKSFSSNPYESVSRDTVLNSNVVSLTYFDDDGKEIKVTSSEGFTITFDVKDTTRPSEGKEDSVKFWNSNTEEWDDKGIATTSSRSQNGTRQVVGRSSHLTDFALGESAIIDDTTTFTISKVKITIILIVIACTILGIAAWSLMRNDHSQRKIAPQPDLTMEKEKKKVIRRKGDSENPGPRVTRISNVTSSDTDASYSTILLQTHSLLALFANKNPDLTRVEMGIIFMIRWFGIILVTTLLFLAVSAMEFDFGQTLWVSFIAFLAILPLSIILITLMKAGVSKSMKLLMVGIFGFIFAGGAIAGILAIGGNNSEGFNDAVFYSFFIQLACDWAILQPIKAGLNKVVRTSSSSMKKIALNVLS